MNGRVLMAALGGLILGFWFGLIAHMAVLEGSIQAGMIVFDNRAYTVQPVKKEGE